GFRSVNHIDRIQKIPNGHTDGSADTAPNTSKNQRAQNADSISKMDRGSIPSREPELNLQKGKHDIRQCGKYAGHRKFPYFFIFHNKSLLHPVKQPQTAPNGAAVCFLSYVIL